jgi:hypothetical protein
MLGIGVEEPGTLADFLNVQFRADLGEATAAVNVIAGPRPNAMPNEVLLPAGSGRWMYARQHRPDDERWTTPQLVAAIRAAAGMPDLAVTVDAVSPFTMAGALVTTFRAGAGSSWATPRTG